MFNELNGEFGKNVIIFGMTNSLSVHTYNREKDFLVVGEGPTDGLSNTIITAEAKNSVNITKPEKTFVFTKLQPTVFCMLMT